MAEFVACQLCDDEHVAVFYCVECGENMCELIANAHQKAKLSRNHKLISLSGKSSSSEHNAELQALTKLVVCPDHKDDYKFYDEECKQVICRDCIALIHHGHRCISIKDAANNFRSSMESKCQEVKFQLDAVKQGEKKVTVVRSDLDKTYQKVHQEIGEAFDKVSPSFLLLLHSIDAEAAKLRLSRQCIAREMGYISNWKIFSKTRPVYWTYKYNKSIINTKESSK
jgi:tripartite motif-containing protein 56